MLHGRVEIQSFSLSVKNYFTVESSKQVKYFLTQEEKFCISKWSCNVLLIIETPIKYQTILLSLFFLPAQGVIYYVAMATVIFSNVKITCYFDV